MVFRAQRPGGADLLWVRSLDSLEAQALPGTDGGDFPFWSPDSRFIGFFAQGKLKKIDVAGGPAQTLCDAPAGEGGTWNRDGIIVFAPTTFAGLSRVSAAGGQPTALTTVDPSGKEISHRWPQFLPDGRRFLFLVQPENTVRVGSLDSRDTKTLLTADSKVLYAPPGYVLFMREGTLTAQPFDASRAELTGDGFPVAEQVRGNALNGRAAFSVSENGVLSYRTGVGNVTEMTWFDRSGKLLQSIGQPGNYMYQIDLSPDDGRAVVGRREASRHFDLWLFDLARGTTSRLTFSASGNVAPHWSPDGSRIAFTSDRDGGIRNLYQKSASGAGQDEVLLKSSVHKATTSWSSDGRFIVYDSDDPKTGTDLWVLPLLGDRKPTPFLRTEFNEGQGRLSPDGRWMAYVSDETGRNEVYVQPFPASGAKWQISASGGLQPRWRRDGKELFYLDLSGPFVMAVEVRAAASAFDVGAPAALFRMRPGSPTFPGPSASTSTQPYAVSADGRRFLILSPVAETASDPITVVLNWDAALKK
jgi:Tol biopolymer transport system component